MPQRKSVVLSDDKINKILDETVPKGQCKPKKLFTVKESANGTTSDWQVCQRFLPTLSQILDETGGLQLTMKPLTKQLQKWLAKEDFMWAIGDIEASADGLRVMIRSLKAMKENSGRPPRNYSSLQILLDKIPVESRRTGNQTANPALPSGESTDEPESSQSESEEIVVKTKTARGKPGITRSLMLPWETTEIVAQVKEQTIAEDVGGQAVVEQVVGPGIQAIGDKTADQPKRLQVRKRPSSNIGFDLEIALSAQTTEQNDIVMPADYRPMSKAAKRDSKTKSGSKKKMKKRRSKTSKDTTKENAEAEIKTEGKKDEKGKSKKSKNTHEAKKIKKGKQTGQSVIADENPTADPLQTYMDWDGTNPDRTTMIKRVHSKIWHASKAEQLAYGMSDKEAKDRASKDAKSAVARFLKAMHMA